MRPIWDELGIAATDDEAAIRKAYAERLRTTNPEDNAEGFKALRSAYEQALNYARYRKRYPEDATDEDVDDASNFDGTVDLLDLDLDLQNGTDNLPLPPPAAPHVEPDPDIQAHREAWSRLVASLRGEETPWVRLEALETLLKCAAMERVDVFARTEAWLAELLLRSRPASDVLVERAIAFFQWEAAASRDLRRYGPADVVALRGQIANEKVANGFLARVRDKRHEFHAAYRELSQDPKQRNWFSRVWSLRRINVVERMLNYAQGKAPLALYQLNYEASDWWRGRLRRWRKPLGWLAWALRAGVFGLIIIALLTSVSENSTEVFARDRCAEIAAPGPASSISPDQASRIRDACSDALDIMPDSLMMRQYAGLAELRLGNYAQARRHFMAVLETSPLDSVAMFGAGLATLQGRFFPNAEADAAMSAALALDPSVRMYFVERGLPAPELPAAPVAPEFLSTVGAANDTPPALRASPTQEVFDEAYKHFGINEPMRGRAVVECLVRLDGKLDQCRVRSETPRNEGVAELALRVAAALRYDPASLNGQPVDGAAIVIPFTFRIEGDSSGSGEPPRQ